MEYSCKCNICGKSTTIENTSKEGEIKFCPFCSEVLENRNEKTSDVKQLIIALILTIMCFGCFGIAIYNQHQTDKMFHQMLEDIDK